MAKQQSARPSSGAAPDGGRTARGIDRQPGAPIENSAGKLTAEELREMVEFGGGAEPEDEEPDGFDTNPAQGGAGIPDPATGRRPAAGSSPRQDAAPAGPPGRLTSIRILPDRGHSEAAEEVKPEGTASPNAESGRVGRAGPACGTDPGGTPPKSVNPAHHHPVGLSPSGQPSRQNPRELQWDDGQHPDPSLRKRDGNSPPARKPRQTGVMKPVAKSLRFAAMLLLAAGFGAAGYFAGNPEFDLADLTGLTQPPAAMPFLDPSRESISTPAADGTAPDGPRDVHPVSESLKSLAERASQPNLPAGNSVFPMSDSKPLVPIVIAFRPADGASRFTEISPEAVKEWDMFFQTAAQPETHPPGPAAENSAPLAAQGNAGSQQAAFAPAAGKPDQSKTGASGGLTKIAYMPAKHGKLLQQQAAGNSVTESDAASPASDSGPPLRESGIESADRAAQEAPAELSMIDAAALLEFGRRLDAIEERLRSLQKPHGFPKLKFAQPQDTPRPNPSFNRQGASVNGSTQSPQAFPAAKAEGAPSFSLIAGALGAESAAFRNAGIGDRVPGFGTVTDIVDYSGGGRILVMENGSVYMN